MARQMPQKRPKGMGNFTMVKHDGTNKEFINDFIDAKMMHEMYVVNALYHYAGLVLSDEALVDWLDKEPFCFFVNKQAYLKAARLYREEYDKKYSQ
jgi:hypothetical protein